MQSGEGKENGEKRKGLISKKSNFARAAHFFLICTFLCRCFARLQLETFRNFQGTCFMEEMSDVFLIAVAHFHPGGR